MKPAREVLFTVVPREEKYTAKSFIDTFVYRSGDALGALADRLVAFLGLSPARLRVALPARGRRLGRERARPREEAEGACERDLMSKFA